MRTIGQSPNILTAMIDVLTSVRQFEERDVVIPSHHVHVHDRAESQSQSRFYNKHGDIEVHYLHFSRTHTAPQI
jgi:hypothetical protein